LRLKTNSAAKSLLLASKQSYFILTKKFADEKANLIEFWANRLDLQAMPLPAQVFIVCFASALLSALMSNTATVTMLIPFAAAFIPEVSVAVLIAVAASLGIPFIISTPINAMVYGGGGVRAISSRSAFRS
jgi:di/tricarboxylate transporter